MKEFNIKTVQEETLVDPWNRSYASKLSLSGPKGIKQMNLGTSFLVAPINHRADKKVVHNFDKVNSYLLERNNSYLKIQNPDEDAPDGQGEGDPEGDGATGGDEGAGSKALKKKKSPQQIKTEYL
mmetsp:Transcript_10301/g.15743  ORF Transcript_10301/g.15743 Transcript_10301/m.15743 type:complete len:125 (-) Transcript_10301:1092-1466(-)|eukprot:CAMPEP_0170503362 /NCGR_PEP_ID=MMETSP0208-20121228/44460_1 /TAXON_ID=197538 /ORGANISM="Strombidium inclinatum, Strain S3" /LENGTH=124 /DNA_ID=CAMNT_0010782961 /DNA_START=543 /DNA_END=917 /DNA_ORIENTATION=-